MMTWWMWVVLVAVLVGATGFACVASSETVDSVVGFGFLIGIVATAVIGMTLSVALSTDQTQEDSWTEEKPIASAVASDDGAKVMVEHPDGTSEVVEGATVWRDGKMVEVVEHHRSQKTCLLGPVSEPDEWSEVELHVQAGPADGSKGGTA